MNYDYKLDNRIGIVTLSGSKTFQDAKNTWEKILQSTKKDSLNAVLMIDTSTSELNPFEVVDLEKWISQNAFPHDVKIAIVDIRERSQTNNWFGETVARNGGWYNISVFNDEESARRWLCT
jgi:hypothetical protein